MLSVLGGTPNAPTDFRLLDLEKIKKAELVRKKRSSKTNWTVRHARGAVLYERRLNSPLTGSMSVIEICHQLTEWHEKTRGGVPLPVPIHHAQL